MLHIGIDTRLTAYRAGGISTYIRELARELAAEPDDHRYTLFASRRADAPLVDGWPQHTVWTPPHHRWERTTLSLELWRHQLDVFHSPDFIPPHRAARRHVITVHDLTFLHYPEHKDQDAIRYYHDQIETAVHHADHILSVSEATRHDLMTLLGVPAEKITVQPHGVDARFRPLSADEQAAARARLHLPARYILFVGTLEPRKNIDTLLDAYQQLDDPPPLILVGQAGWLFATTDQRIHDLQASGHAIMHRDDIDHDALPAVYACADLFCLPSHYEGFGLPVLEAMACGVPVVTADNSSLPEVGGDCARYVPADDADALTAALHAGLTDADWRAQASQCGRQRARGFTWARSAQIARAVYEGRSTS